MLRCILFLVLSCYSLVGLADDRKLEFVLKQGDTVIFDKTLKIAELDKASKNHTLSFTSPVYHQDMVYNGMDFIDVATFAGIDFAKVEEIKFHALDGFIATWSKGVTESPLVVVTGEEGNEALFTDIGEGKQVLNPGPFYVMTTEPSEYKKWTWPFQVYKIEFNYEKPTSDYFPVGADEGSTVMSGYTTFNNLCISCHSVNLEGGDIGPELNIPQNITEYRDTEYLMAFIKNPNSYRAKSRMLMFDHLSDAELSAIIDYLTFMKGLKMMDKIDQ
ncbi:c-type cytochrome [Enterovibrio norvegicus]|uniref:Cytochrome c n=1 Tax=Enterovibrio norvegicus TaxID=188144 RepID=A0ABV4L0T7_9GAMM|nr:cytochrome c [Enterovibrio norvegicus]TKF09271.1 cytochrome c [Enterovibrio norvegicus]TKF35163.1 cytochrome c [Enterovibrio norvegicus]